MIAVVIIDDHPIVRAGMRTVLDAANDVTVVAAGASGADALRLVSEHCPDVLVLDVNLPDLNGVEVTRRLQACGTTTAILVLTVHDDPQTVFGLLESGATGYVLKDEALETLVGAVRAAARGESWLSPAVASQVVRRAVEQAPGEPVEPAPGEPVEPAPGEPVEPPPGEPVEPTPGEPVEPAPSPLTPRELQVLRLLAQGLDNTTIAQRLVVTKRTVQNHVSNIYGKLSVASRTEAALYAIRHKLVEVSSADDARDAV